MGHSSRGFNENAKPQGQEIRDFTGMRRVHTRDAFAVARRGAGRWRNAWVEYGSLAVPF